eukprot:6455078-Amphidinium_carterae.1
MHGLGRNRQLPTTHLGPEAQLRVSQRSFDIAVLIVRDIKLDLAAGQAVSLATSGEKQEHAAKITPDAGG